MSYHISIISGNEDLPLSLESIQSAFSGCDVIEGSREGQVTSLVLARAAGGEVRSFCNLLSPSLPSCVVTELVLG
jgi:hypothetical protein